MNLDDFPVVTEASESYLNQRQLLDYRSEREECLRWLLAYGKDPDRAKGYAKGTVKPRSYRIDRFYRFVWEEEGGYTANLSHEYADAWMDHLAHRDVSAAHKVNCQESLKMLYKWLHHERGLGEWEPDITFSANRSSNPRDFLTKEERSAIRDAALEYGPVHSYKNLTPAERDRWKEHLAQRFEKPESEVEPADRNRANGWKIASLVWVSLDAGLRPTEVNRSTMEWVDTDNSVPRIPKEDSTKNTDHWVVGLRDRTSDILQNWCEERRVYPEYDETESTWLTREGNPWGVSCR